MSEHTHSRSHSHSHSSSQRHHSSHSSSGRRRSSDVKAYRKTRYFFAFLLFITVTVMSLGITAKVSLLDKNNIANIFTNHEYVSGLYEDVHTYADDMCRRNSVPLSAVDSVLTFDAVNEIDRAFILGTLSLDEQYSQTVYMDKLGELSDSISDSIKETVRQNGLAFAAGQEKSCDAFAQDLTGYLNKRMSFPYLEKTETIANLGSTAALVMSIVGAVLSAALVLIVITLGSEVYRNLRSVTHATLASGLSCFIICGAYSAVKSAKSLHFFPLYLNDSIMAYLDSSSGALAITGSMLFAASFVLMAVVWKLKSNALDS